MAAPVTFDAALGCWGGKAPCGSTQLTKIKHGGYTGRSMDAIPARVLLMRRDLRDAVAAPILIPRFVASRGVAKVRGWAWRNAG